MIFVGHNTTCFMGCQYENNSGIYIDIAAAFPKTRNYDETNIVGNYVSSDEARNTIVTYV